MSTIWAAYPATSSQLAVLLTLVQHADTTAPNQPPLPPDKCAYQEYAYRRLPALAAAVAKRHFPRPWLIASHKVYLPRYLAPELSCLLAFVLLLLLLLWYLQGAYLFWYKTCSRDGLSGARENMEI